MSSEKDNQPKPGLKYELYDHPEIGKMWSKPLIIRIDGPPAHGETDDGTGRPATFRTPVERVAHAAETAGYVWSISCGCNLLAYMRYSYRELQRSPGAIERSKELYRSSFRALAHDPGCECFV